MARMMNEDVLVPPSRRELAERGRAQYGSLSNETVCAGCGKPIEGNKTILHDESYHSTCAVKTASKMDNADEALGYDSATRSTTAQRKKIFKQKFYRV